VQVKSGSGDSLDKTQKEKNLFDTRKTFVFLFDEKLITDDERAIHPRYISTFLKFMKPFVECDIFVPKWNLMFCGILFQFLDFAAIQGKGKKEHILNVLRDGMPFASGWIQLNSKTQARNQSRV
ncbi:hypothetical protein ACJX0J_017672, partial [Zea mays]